MFGVTVGLLASYMTERELLTAYRRALSVFSWKTESVQVKKMHYDL